MEQEERFLDNLKRWSSLNNDVAQKLPSLECKEVFLCENDDGQPNLKKITGSGTQYFHSRISPFQESQQWFLSLDLKDTTILYVYGIGLGYYYDILKNWLKEDNKRFVIFLEDNLEVIKYFLQTERGSDFLKNIQVKLFHFFWETSYFSINFISSLFSLMPFKISALKFYEQTELKRITELHARLAFFHDVRFGISAEFLSFNPLGFISNFYKNLSELPNSKLELKMIGHFKGIPAIICGAGPSLAKNIDVLKTLQDKALIMAGGTAMNVLNGAGIRPHFGLGIDPNPSHYNRLISNIAFEEPFFYRQRMYHPALKMIHGERIFVTGAGGYRLPAWFEDRFEIPKVEPIEEGHNVVNFNLSIARELGCNPIIIVGVDLAYSDNLSYAPGLVRHALQDPKNAFLTKYSHEELLVKNDINGVPVNTLWKWVNESLWFAQFASRNPELLLLNCTEGGIGFSHVPNMRLADAAEKYLTQIFDFSAIIHGEIQNSSLNKDLSQQTILDNLEIIGRSLLRCEGICSTLMFEFGKLFEKVQSEETVPENYLSPLMQDNITQLEDEDAFKFHLQDYKERFLEVMFPRLHFLESDTLLFTEKEILTKRTYFDMTLYQFLSKVARHNLNIMKEIFSKAVAESKKAPLEPSKKALSWKKKLFSEREKAKKKEIYRFQAGQFEIIDPEMHLNYKKNCTCNGKGTFYSNGAPKTQLFMLEQKFHGPSFFYGEKGNLLALNWYIEGFLEGKGTFYYPSGELYALKRYKHGKLHGRQEYYYLNGLPKSILYYKDGLIDNELILFHPNGQMKREMHFLKGKRNGMEKMWNSDGVLILEARYKDNIPIGIAREWHPNGNLSKEIIYEKNSENFNIRQWREDGTLISSELAQEKDYFDYVAQHSKTLNDSLQNIYKTLVNIAPSIPMQKKTKDITTIEEDLFALKQAMDKLNKFNQEILTIGCFDGKNPKEAIWKTPEVKKLIQKQLDSVNKTLTDATKDTQMNLQDLFNKMNPLEPDQSDKNSPNS